MEKYSNLGLVGEGSYGAVLKCKHKVTGELVAIKKFLEPESDKNVKKIALREIRMLKLLRHENLVNLIEVFRRKKRLHLVFEFVDHTVLDELERFPSGLGEELTRKILWQVLQGVDFCHTQNVIHRDIKPENILISNAGVVKLCDFGFARTLAAPGKSCTDYVATRWYRAPELLVGDTRYGSPVDIWAIGCLLGEMLTGDPMFPGDSDMDQLFCIIKCFGGLCPRHKDMFHANVMFTGMRLPAPKDTQPLKSKVPKASEDVMAVLKASLQLDDTIRPTCSQLMAQTFFTKNNFPELFQQEMRARSHDRRGNQPPDKSRRRQQHYAAPQLKPIAVRGDPHKPSDTADKWSTQSTVNANKHSVPATSEASSEAKNTQYRVKLPDATNKNGTSHTVRQHSPGGPRAPGAHAHAVGASNHAISKDKNHAQWSESSLQNGLVLPELRGALTSDKSPTPTTLTRSDKKLGLGGGAPHVINMTLTSDRNESRSSLGTNK